MSYVRGETMKSTWPYTVTMENLLGDLPQAFQTSATHINAEAKSFNAGYRQETLSSSGHKQRETRDGIRFSKGTRCPATESGFPGD